VLKLPKIDSPLTYQEITAKLDSRSRHHLKRYPFSLSIALAKAVIAGDLEYQPTAHFMTRLSLYGSGHRVNPKREKPTAEAIQEDEQDV
jgi:hypothetical protein